MGTSSARTRHLLRFLAGAAGLSLGLIGAVALILKVRRPEVLSSGSIAFALNVIALLIFLLLFLSSLRTDAGRKGYALGWLDVFYAASVAVSLVSFLVASRARENFLQPFMLITAFAVYLLVRTNRRRFEGTPALLLAGALVAFAGVVAAHGLAQWASGREMRGFFFNVNHFAMFLAMILPLAWAAARLRMNAFLRFSGYGVTALMIAAVGLARCRTAYTALILVGGVFYLVRHLPRTAPAGGGPRRRRSAVRGVLVFGAVGVVVVSALAVSFKPMSAAGRLLIWKVSARTALAHPVTGVGYGNFPAVYNVEQGRYFEEGKGSAIERLSASADAYAFNDFLESFVELGLIGLVVLLPFWGFVLWTAAGVLSRGDPPPAGPASSSDGRLALGASGSVLAYMIMAVFYYPSRILPIVMLFSVFLGWLAGDKKPAPDRARRSFRVFGLAFAAVSLSAALILFPTLWKRFIAERSWSKAVALARAGRTTDAVAATRAAYPLLRSDPDFVDLHAGLLLGVGDAREAATVLDAARVYSSNPRLAEKLASAYVALGDLEAALGQARKADSILPWRLSSKALLADISVRRGDPEGTSRYARLVLDTPMKVRTAAGEALKTKAFELWTGSPKRSGETESLFIDLLARLPAEFRGGVLGALQAMGSRSGPFVEALRAAGPEERTCIAFLLANMPDRDVLGLDANFLVENVRTACLARRTVPLAMDVPDVIFLEEVLPYAVGDEPRDPWRPDFFERFKEAAVSSPSVEDAVVRLNRDVFLEFRLAFAERDMRKPLLSPRQSIEKGAVSCGEAAVMLVDACRSVGIPARMIVLPRWPHIKGGHIWVEVWDHGRWRHISAYDPALLEQTWIPLQIAETFPPGSRAAVFAAHFRRTGLRLLAGRDISFTDITENYLK